MLKNSYIIILITFLISGCATLSKDECIQANWHSIGYTDGAKGSNAGRFQKHQKACAKHGIQANYETYKAGHRSGLEEVYCKPRSGYEAGLRGERYGNVCPKRMERNFLPAYNYGRDIYLLTAKQREFSAKSNSLNMRVSGIDQQIADLKQKIVDIRMGRRHDRHAKVQVHVHPTQQQINSTGAYRGKRKLFELHSQRELALQKNLLQSYMSNKHSGKSSHVGNRTGRQSLKQFVALHKSRGRLHNQIAWEQARLKSPKKQGGSLRTLKSRLAGIRRQLQQYRRYPMPQSEKQRLAQLAFHQGMLSDQVRLNAGVNSPDALNVLVGLHFKLENTRIGLRRNLQAQSRPRKNNRQHIRQLRHEIRTLKREKEDSLHSLDDIAHRLEKLEHDISHLKARSPY